MSTTFVTGGSGFVGRNLIRALRARGGEIRALARTDATASLVTALGAEPVRGDLDDGDVMREAMRGCDLVIHAAANVKEWGRRAEFEHGNVIGTRNVVGAARAAGVPRLVHLSTEAVLGDGSTLRRIDETYPRPKRPFARYCASKAAAEALVLAANCPELETVVVRPRFVWGYGDTSVLPQFVQAVNDGRFMWIDGGRYLTSTCHVANVVDGALRAADRGRGGEIYFLTDGDPIQYRDFVSRLLATQGVAPGTRSVPLPIARFLAWVAEALWDTLRLPGKPPATRMTVSLFGREVTLVDAKARRELGYASPMTIERGLRELERSSGLDATSETDPAASRIGSCEGRTADRASGPTGTALGA